MQRNNLCMLFSPFFLQFYVSPSLAGFVLMVMPPMTLLAVVYGRYLRSISKRTQDALAEATQVTLFPTYWFINSKTSDVNIDRLILTLYFLIFHKTPLQNSTKCRIVPYTRV